MTAGRPRKPKERRDLNAVGDGHGTSHGGKKETSKEVEIVDAEIVLDDGTTTTERAKRKQQIPDLPYGVYGKGAEEWHAIWDAGWWLHPKEDYHWVEQIARAYCELDEFRERVQRDGLIVKGYAGQTTAHPLIKEMRACESVIRSCLSTLGFSPTDRARLNLIEAQAQNSLQALQKKTQASRDAQKNGH